MLILETHTFPPLWDLYAVFGIRFGSGPDTFTLPRVKGAVIALQWALYMHGFDGDEPSRIRSPYEPENEDITWANKPHMLIRA